MVRPLLIAPLAAGAEELVRKQDDNGIGRGDTCFSGPQCHPGSRPGLEHLLT
jgi:hypothetical protein